jgi:hypothetical protein
MTARRFPKLDRESIAVTRDALHDYSRILGDWTKSCRPKRKHWWHAGLRPSLSGLTTGVIHSGIDFELELDLREGRLQGRTSNGEQLTETLIGQPAGELALQVKDFLTTAGIDDARVPENSHAGADGFEGYSADRARDLGGALNSVAAALESFRAGIREETSPIQLWPHHFDLSMLWLPGGRIAGQDPDNEEYADMQMNFGFTFGDEGIPEPYFYITAYPLPAVLPKLPLPPGTTWQTGGFSGAVLLYRSLVENSDPDGYLLELWNGVLAAGRDHFITETN